MYIYRLKNLNEETYLRIELTERVKLVAKDTTSIMTFELDLMNTLRKGYSYGILNRYVLKNQELIKWVNDAKLGGIIEIITDDELIKKSSSEKKIITIDLVLQGDTKFYSGSKNNMYSEIENITSFGIESLNKVIFKTKSSLKRNILIGAAILTGTIGTLILKLPTTGILATVISSIAIVELIIKDKQRIRRFIEFNQKRVDYSKVVYEKETGRKGKDLKFIVEKGKCFIREVGV